MIIGSIGLVGVAVLAVSAFVLWSLARSAKSIRRDEFSRRNSAGVLEYESYAQAEAARRRKGIVEAFAPLIPIAFCGVIVGIVLICVAPYLLYKEHRAKAEAHQRCQAGDISACTCNGGLTFCLPGEKPD